MKTISRALSVTLLTVFLMFASVGCSKQDEEKIEVTGSWVTGVKSEGISFDDKTFYENYLKGFDTKLNFGSDGKVEIKAKLNGSDISGDCTWTLNDDTLRIADSIGGINGTPGEFVFKYKDGVFLAEQPEYLCLKRA